METGCLAGARMLDPAAAKYEVSMYSDADDGEGIGNVRPVYNLDCWNRNNCPSSSKPSASAAALASAIPTSAQARTPTHPTPTASTSSADPHRSTPCSTGPRDRQSSCPTYHSATDTGRPRDRGHVDHHVFRGSISPHPLGDSTHTADPRSARWPAAPSTRRTPARSTEMVRSVVESAAPSADSVHRFGVRHIRGRRRSARRILPAR